MTNPFAIFDLPVAFNVDQALLSERYLVLQKSLHPDNFVTADAQEQRIAMQKSTEVNDALKNLERPDSTRRSDYCVKYGKSTGFRAKEHTRYGIPNAAIRMARRARKY